MTPDDIRSAIESNPQSQETRTYLITQAVENDMADEIPDEWTMNLYNAESDESYDDTADLIADEYKFSDYMSMGYADVLVSDPQSDVIISAHESGALSIRVSPAIEPVAKFDIGVADQIVAMIQATVDWNAYAPEGSLPPEAVEPITGISVLAHDQETRFQTIETVFTLSIPGSQDNPQTYDFILNDTADIWLNGLTAMANSAETYGRQDVPDDNTAE